MTVSATVEHALEHPHNKLIHLPTGLAVAVLARALARGTERAGRILAGLGLLAAVASVATGTLQAHDVAEARPDLAAVLETHRYAGWAAAGAWALTAAAWFAPRGSRGLRLGASVVLGVAVSIAGLFGGWVTLG